MAAVSKLKMFLYYLAAFSLTTDWWWLVLLVLGIAYSTRLPEEAGRKGVFEYANEIITRNRERCTR